jgi:hypothetical protein
MGRHWICRVLIAHGPALVIDSGLREHGTEFTFARASGLAWGFTGPAFGFGLHHKNLRSVHLDVEVRNRRASHGRETELLGAMDIFLVPDLNICSNRFGGSLDRFSGNL